MNTSKNEFLSAFLDDEAGEFERRRLFDELNRDNELGQTLNRYALVGEVMRAKQSRMVTDNQQFLAGIHAGIEEEPEYNETVVQFANEAVAANDSWWRSNAMKFGMTASVAVAAVAGVLLFQAANQPGVSNDTLAASEMTQQKTQPVSLAQTALVNPVSGSAAAGAGVNLADSSTIRQSNKHLDRQTRDALKQYVTLHMQHRASNGIIPSIQAAVYSQ